jgi:hypothetical protein
LTLENTKEVRPIRNGIKQMQLRADLHSANSLAAAIGEMTREDHGNSSENTDAETQ